MVTLTMLSQAHLGMIARGCKYMYLRLQLYVIRRT